MHESLAFLGFNVELPELEMRASGVIGSDYHSVQEKVGSTRKEVGFHGYIAVIVAPVSPFHSSCSSGSI